jgi:predicted 3-demethylubiquinone-9 3-methyltransferase (glyoxalase superfamily)
MQKITPNLWFNGNAREAVEYYISIFPNSKITGGSTYPQTKEAGLADFQLELAGKDLTIEFELGENSFVAINADATFAFTEAVSFQVDCKDQEEIDYYWNKLSAVPESEQCGWCKDKYGVSWQIVPQNMAELMSRPNAFRTLMNQHKIIVEEF